MDLATCAAAYSVTGGLVSQTPAPTSSSTSTSAPASTTTSTSTEDDEEETASTTVGSSIPNPSFEPTTSYVSPNSTATTVKPPVPTTSKIQEGAGSSSGPAGAFALIVAGLAALL